MTKPGDRLDEPRSPKRETTGKRRASQPTARPATGVSPTLALKGRRPFGGFRRERATYQRLKPQLLDRAEGKYVVIVGDEVVGPLESHDEAERAGYDRFGLGPLYVKQVVAEEPVAEVTRSRCQP